MGLVSEARPGPRLASYLGQNPRVTGSVHSGPQRKVSSVQGSGVSQSILSPELHMDPVHGQGTTHPGPWALGPVSHGTPPKTPIPPSLGVCPLSFFPSLVKRGSESDLRMLEILVSHS